MSFGLILWIGIPVILLLIILYWVYRTFNNLTWRQIKVDKIAGNLEAVLKKKFDMIPALVEVVKGYAKHENSTFTEVVRLRSQWGAAKDVNEKLKTANVLESALSKLLVVQERYPQLKANRNFQNIQRNITIVEAQILNERKYYNEVVRRYNVIVRLFPSNILAKMFGFKEKEFYSNEE
jgi:LemA protein